ncbi:MAG: hypothetical protein RBT70_01030 [Alphaproteobacteria bacterium]|jgi:hypothetical protein|nr:hypothetical protein [Alphaproteobacteria bacterium]
MTNDNTAIALPFAEMQEQAVHLPASEAVAIEIIQDNFSSDAERDAFTQAVKMHGVTFLYLSNSSLPEPSSRDLNTIGRLARVLSRFWPQALVIGGCHD